MILRLSEQLRPALERPTRRNGALPVLIQVTNALRIFAKGDFQTEVGDLSGVSQSAVSKNLTQVAVAIGELAGRYIQFPTGEEVGNEICKIGLCFPQLISMIRNSNIFQSA